MKKTLDKKVALKLINQYADNYKRLEEEHKSLLRELKDCKANLTVNKDIIDSLLKSYSIDLKVKTYLAKSKEEITILNERNELLSKENSNLREKSLKSEFNVNESLSFYRDCKDSLANRVFVLENTIKKKDSMIAWLNKKLKALRESDFQYEYSNEIHEIYVSEPNESLNCLFGELQLYKQAFDNSLAKIKENKLEINRLHKRIEAINSGQKEKDPKTTIEELNAILFKCQRKTWETDEWVAILSYLNITKEDIANNTQNNKFISKILEAIELLNKVVIQRNHQLTQAKKEIEKLRDSNNLLNNEHLGLMKTIFSLKSNQDDYTQKKMKKDDSNNEQYINTNISMINNISLDDINKKDLKKIIGLNLKDDLLKNFMCNQSLSLENESSSFYKSENSIGKPMNYTQVTENSFDIIENSDLFTSLQKKKLKRIKDIESHCVPFSSEENSVEYVGNEKKEIMKHT